MAADLDVRVRPHLMLAGGVLAAVALLAAGFTLLAPPGPGEAFVLLALLGCTLFLAGVAFWYLPSFAKRAVTPALVARAAPVPFGASAALVVLALADVAPQATLSTARLVAVPALLGFALVLVLTPVAGPPWRGGAPMWRKEGPFRAGDRAALVGFGSAAAWLVVAAGFLAAAPGLPIGTAALVAWVAGLSLFVLSALAHLLPRARGAPLPASFLLAGVVAADAGALLVARPFPGPFAPSLLGAGLLLASLAVGLPGRGRGKPAGPRLRQARPLLLAAWLALCGSAVAFALTPWSDRAGLLGASGLLVALLFGLAALSLLTLPVLFNQRPDGRLVLPAAVVGVASWALLPLGALLDPVVLRAGVVGLCLFLLLWLGALWPLRHPRRECPP